MKLSHLLVRAQIAIADLYTKLLTHAKEQLQITEPVTPELGLPVLSTAKWQVYCNGKAIQEFDRMESATAYIRVQKIWVSDSDTRFEIKKVEQC